MCEYALDHEWKSYRGHQIFQWLYRNRVFDIDEMSNVSKETREILKKDFIVNPLELIKKHSRQYAKRQYTWFKNQFDVHWYDVNLENFEQTIEQVTDDIEKILKV